MADACVSVVLEKLLSISFDGIEQEVKVVTGVQKEIKSLTDTLTTIRGVLEDAEERQMKEEAVKLWFEEFKDICYDAEDILDEWSTRSRISHMKQSDPAIKKKVQSNLFNLLSCFCFKPVIIRHEIGIKIKELNERLVGVNENIQKYGLRKMQSNDVRRIRQMQTIVVPDVVPDVPMIYGLAEDKDILISKLLSESSITNLNVPVISIVGIGGVGKTTLAQLILKDEKVITSFDNLVWVCLSDPFLIENVAKEIIQQVKGNVPDTIGWQVLHKNLSECVQGKRFILVLDDFWSCSYKEWLQLKNALNCGDARSRIIVTSRRVRFAQMINSSYIHMLGLLSNDECRSLFKYEKIESYYSLYSYLKLCLMYFAVFPKDAIIKKKEIVQLWMAQDYLGSDDDGSVDLEMKGRDYFDNLAMLSFIQDFQKDDEGNIISCKMHDLVHDFVQFLTKNETIILEEKIVSSAKVCHMCAVYLDWTFIYQQKNLRTLRIHPKKNNIVGLELLHQLTCLRALSLCDCGIQELPSEVGKLLHLRYLDLSRNSELNELPETICSLINLQTLNLNECKSLTRLPEGIRKLSNLRHLEIGGCEFRPYYSHQGLHCFPPGRLSCLRTLKVFVVCVMDAQRNKEGCMIGELTLLSHLEGHLKIKRFGHVADVGNAAQVKFKTMENLLSLVLEVGWKQENQEKMVRVDGILEALQPHANLKKLEIKYFQGIRLPSWISSLSNLTVLNLIDFHQCLQLPALGKLESLEFLHLRRLLSVKSLGCEFYGFDKTLNRQVIFPKLKILKLHVLPDLEELDLSFQNGVDFFPNLRELVISDFFPNLRMLRIGWLSGLQKLPDLGKLISLETLELSRMVGLKHSFHEFMGIPMTTSDDTSGGERVEFPALTNLFLLGMTEWEEEEQGCENNGIPIMPHLSKLSIYDCPKLKVIPSYMFSHALREVTIQICPQLTGIQPRLPPLLEKLKLKGDVGDLSWSLYPLLNYNHNYPNLNYLEISDSSQSFLPQGFNLLRSIRQLVFHNCEVLDFMPHNLKHLTMLEQLEISYCPILAGRFSKGDISISSSHYYTIFIRLEQRELTEIEESSRSDLEKSSQPNDNVHSGIFCHNCEMHPIVGKRYKCQDCYEEHTGGFDLCENCYNTPSKRPDLANQHHTQGHIFEHIANCGDNSGPLHSNDTSEYAEGDIGFVKPSEIEELDKA